ncbi:chromate efflux transporter [Sediminivirga luteola]|uniref:Chromate transporter protein n=1 Tax=Sediminivirga luteola TaxID=1774748 RepID=A0A8J2TXV2_9MICO|nr:chromate efflux transporter [Sediminivirga luteola]MCI2265853.1 chromate efflux transporter [Sediminivirga luteola]GGA14128.1 chromate transporter protein [Sediminivirga luteola]
MSTSATPGRAAGDGPPGTAGEVFTVFLRLGLTSFGGPVAHLGYFREAFVVRRGWLSDRAYADLVALCQFLPGPASSQVGMAIGLQRAGIGGLLAAWAAFTLPSAILLLAFAYGVMSFGETAGSGWLQGLKAVAVAVVAQAVLGMARTLAPDARRATLAAAAVIAVLLIPHALTQIGVIVVTGLLGLLWLGRSGERAATPTDVSDPPGRMPAGASVRSDAFPVRIGRRAAATCLALFAALLAGLPLLASATGEATLRLADTFYRAGSLVFGGGHVVLPLLQAETVPTGMVADDAFLAGYGAAQAVPGPLFTFAAYLGAVDTLGPGGVLGAALALLAIFLPAALLVVGALPFWERLRHSPAAQHALSGVGAGVVGILAAALYDPVFTQGITSVAALAFAVAAFVVLTKWNAPPWAVVIGAALLGSFLL